MVLKMTEERQKGMENWRKGLNKQEREKEKWTMRQQDRLKAEMKGRARESVNGNSNDRGIRRWAITQIRGRRGLVVSTL